MNEKKLIYITLVNNYYEIREVEENSYCCRRLTPTEVSDLLNKQQATIEAKDKEIAELNQQCADFLGDEIKALEEFGECTDKLKQKIFEIKKLKIENDALRYALKYLKHIEVDIDIDGVVDDE